MAYKKRESLLELRDLLFGEGVGLLSNALSAHHLFPDAARLPLDRGAPF